MLPKETLTGETLKKSFHDNFELTLFIINVARHLVRSGHDVNVPRLLKDVQKNPSHYTQERLETERDEIDAIQDG